jgi:hypothetical protein
LGPAQAADGVPEELEGFEGRASSVGHDAHVVVPVELVIEENTEVADRVGRFHTVFQGAGRVGEPNVGGPLLAGVRVSEENYLCFVRFDG